MGCAPCSLRHPSDAARARSQFLQIAKLCPPAASPRPTGCDAVLAALEAAGVGADHRFLLDLNAVHGLKEEQRAAVGREVSAVAAPDAHLLTLAFTPDRRGPLPRGMSREELERAFRGWQVVDEKAEPRFYRLARA